MQPHSQPSQPSVVELSKDQLKFINVLFVEVNRVCANIFTIFEDEEIEDSEVYDIFMNGITGYPHYRLGGISDTGIQDILLASLKELISQFGFERTSSILTSRISDDRMKKYFTSFLRELNNRSNS